MLWPKTMRPPPDQTFIHLQDIRGASTKQSSSVFSPGTSWSKGRSYKQCQKAPCSALLSQLRAPECSRGTSAQQVSPKRSRGSWHWAFAACKADRDVCSLLAAFAARHASLSPRRLLSSCTASAPHSNAARSLGGGNALCRPLHAPCHVHHSLPSPSASTAAQGLEPCSQEVRAMPGGSQ